ncbi:hypothetical protein PORCAN_1742 [Porphyromonas crevioricanis JCM 13913]|nr:hypothetical protein PORCAN_1742 [Porphyromonas crevioricanis JCM 13913]
MSDYIGKNISILPPCTPTSIFLSAPVAVYIVTSIARQRED